MAYDSQGYIGKTRSSFIKMKLEIEQGTQILWNGEAQVRKAFKHCLMPQAQVSLPASKLWPKRGVFVIVVMGGHSG